MLGMNSRGFVCYLALDACETGDHMCSAMATCTVDGTEVYCICDSHFYGNGIMCTS